MVNFLFYEGFAALIWQKNSTSEENFQSKQPADFENLKFWRRKKFEVQSIKIRNISLFCKGFKS